MRARAPGHRRQIARRPQASRREPRECERLDSLTGTPSVCIASSGAQARSQAHASARLIRSASAGEDLVASPQCAASLRDRFARQRQQRSLDVMDAPVPALPPSVLDPRQNETGHDPALRGGSASRVGLSGQHRGGMTAPVRPMPIQSNGRAVCRSTASEQRIPVPCRSRAREHAAKVRDFQWRC